MYFSTILLSVFSLIVLFLLTKLMGYRQISQLSAFDYINGITIGSIAAEMAIANKEDYMRPLIAMIIYGIAVLFVSILSSKSIRLRRFLVGKPYILMEKGELCRENLAKSKIDINEFMTQLRVNGFFSLNEIETILLEPDGRLSILPKSNYKAVSPADLKLFVKRAEIPSLIICDGRLLSENLSRTGFDENWVCKQMKIHQIQEYSDIFVATVDTNGTFDYYLVKNAIPKETTLI